MISEPPRDGLKHWRDGSQTSRSENNVKRNGGLKTMSNQMVLNLAGLKTMQNDMALKPAGVRTMSFDMVLKPAGLRTMELDMLSVFYVALTLPPPWAGKQSPEKGLNTPSAGIIIFGQ